MSANEKTKCFDCKIETETEKVIAKIAYYANGKPIFICRCHDCEKKRWEKSIEYIY